MKSFLLCIFLLLLTTSTQAVTSLVLTPQSIDGVKQLKQLADAEVLAVTPIFSVSEQMYLKKAKHLSYAALKVKVESLKKFQQWAQQHIPQVKVEQRARVTLNSISDNLYKEQWGLENRGGSQVINISDVDIIELQARRGIDIGFKQLPAETDRKVRVAILDTGIDYRHPDLKGAIFHSKLECEALLKYEQCQKEHTPRECDQRWVNYDADGNGYPLDCAGWNVLGNGSPLSRVKGSNDASDTIGHGTHIAGVIAARNNGQGIVGISQQVEILPVKVMGDVKAATFAEDLPNNQEGQLPPLVTYADFFARGLLYAIRSGAEIINMSLGWSRGVDSALMHDLVKLAVERNILVVAAAGNDSTEYPIFPCTYDGVICVGAYSADGTISHFSNFGPSVDIVAPGQKILSSWPMKLSAMYYTERKGYEFKNGTSMATPFVVGALARLLNAGISPQEAYARILAGASPSRSYQLEAGVNKYSQSGLLNLANSFTVTARPFFIPLKKAPIYLVWDGVSKKLKFDIKLKNIWQTAKNLSAKLTLFKGKQDALLAMKQQSLAEVHSGQTVTLSSELLLNSTDSRSEFVVAIKLRDEQGVLNTVYQQLEIILPVTPKRHHPLEQLISLTQSIDTENSEIRTFTALTTAEMTSSFLISKKSRRGLTFQILQVNRQEQTSKLSRPLRVRMLPNQVAGVWQLDFDLDGQLDYVIAQRMLKTVRERSHSRRKTANNSSGNQFVFYFFNKDFSPKQVHLLGQSGFRIVYDNQHATLGKDFIWVKNGEQLAPCWMGKGDDLVAQNQPFNPWKPEQSKKKGTFIYFLGTEKLQSLSLDDKYKLISLKAKQSTQAVVTYAEGKGFSYHFFTSILDDLQQGLDYAQELKFFSAEASRYLMIGDLQQSRLFGYENSLFTDIDPMGNLYVGVENGSHGEVFDLKNSSLIDPLHAMAGGFKIADQFNFWAIGKYQLKFFIDDQLSAQTSLKRFSFMPGMTFDQFLYPVETVHFGDRRSAIYFPGGLGVSLSSEIITTRNQGQEIFRPAIFRIFATQGCVELNHQSVERQTDLVFLCPNSVRFISL